jgi:hypothetical protein
MEIVQLTLMKGINKDPDRLQDAIQTLKNVGQFVTLDVKYAARLGVLSGELPEERIAAVEDLDVVSALQRNEAWHALG